MLSVLGKGEAKTEEQHCLMQGVARGITSTCANSGNLQVSDPIPSEEPFEIYR